MHLDRKMVPNHLLGSYNGTKIQAEACLSVTIPAHAGLWEGGSRDTYQAIELATGRAVAVSDNMSSPWNSSRQDQTITLRPGLAVVRHSIFCGKDTGLRFYVHPENAAALLPAPAAGLSEDEQFVLEATCKYKSSYNGRDRYTIATEYLPISARKLSRADWEAAKASLIEKKLLNKAGAVTTAGRNART
jgi:hypothetical protein